MTAHVVMFSGGLGSWLAARRTIEQLAPGDDLVLLFADVGNDSSPHVGEDEDTYRFLHEAARDIARRTDGQVPCREWLEDNHDEADTVVVVGIDWSESHRLPAIEAGWAPYVVRAPLLEAPLLDRDDMQAACRDAGIEVPRLYRAGFAHNNCGGFCVRAGQAPMELLLREHPDRYRFHEAQEQQLRAHLNKDVAVLRDRTGGTTTPLTLTSFRQRLEAQPDLFDPLDVGGCGCFTESGPT